MRQLDQLMYLKHVPVSACLHAISLEQITYCSEASAIACHLMLVGCQALRFAFSKLRCALSMLVCGRQTQVREESQLDRDNFECFHPNHNC